MLLSPNSRKKLTHQIVFVFKGFKLDQDNNRIFLPKLGWIRYRNSRDVVGKIKNVIVKQCNGLWFVSVQTEREESQPLPTATTPVGIDMGIDGGIFLAVDPKNTSRTCPACQHVCADNRKTQAEFACVRCGYSHHADVVGRDQYFRAGAPLASLWREDAVRSLEEARTHRSELRTSCVTAVGILAL